MTENVPPSPLSDRDLQPSRDLEENQTGTQNHSQYPVILF